MINFIKKICQASIDPILDNLKSIYKNKKHLELTHLIINGFNDSEELIRNLIEFVSTELGKEVPIHFSSFFPYYKMNDIPPTNIEILNKAKEMAIEERFKTCLYGNTPNDQNIHGPECGKYLFQEMDIILLRMIKFR